MKLPFFNKPKDNFHKVVKQLEHSNLEMVYWKLRQTIEELFLLDNPDIEKLQKRFEIVKKERVRRVHEREMKKKILLDNKR